MENVVDGRHFEYGLCYEITCEGGGQFLYQTIFEKCYIMTILCTKCAATNEYCIMGGCNGKLVKWKDVKLTTIACNITKRCPRTICGIMSSLGDIRAYLSNCFMQRPYSDEEIDGLLSTLKIPLARRDRYNDMQAERDIAELFDKFLFDPSFIRRTLKYMDANQDWAIFTIAYRPHVLHHIEQINGDEDIDFVIEAI